MKKTSSVAAKKTTASEKAVKTVKKAGSKSTAEKKLRCAVVGLGIGQMHIDQYQHCPFADLVAICDINPVRLNEVGDKFHIQTRYESITEMLAKENLDVVSIAVPNHLHNPLTIEALKAGCHVLCEKPMAMNAKEAEEMVKVAKECGKRLMIDFSYRTSEQSVAMKKAVDSGTLGEIYYARTQWLRRRGAPAGAGCWFSQKKLAGGGPLLDLGVHRLDLALWLMGYPKPVWVLGSTYDKLAKQMDDSVYDPVANKMVKQDGRIYDVEDLAVALIKFDNGATLELEASWLGNIKERELMSTRLLGSKAGLLQRNLNEGYTFEAEIFLEQNGCQYDMKVHPPVPAAHSHMYNFVEAIVHNKPHDATGEQGLLVMRILDAIYKSAATGKPVEIK